MTAIAVGTVVVLGVVLTIASYRFICEECDHEMSITKNEPTLSHDERLTVNVHVSIYSDEIHILCPPKLFTRLNDLLKQISNIEPIQVGFHESAIDYLRLEDK